MTPGEQQSLELHVPLVNDDRFFVFLKSCLSKFTFCLKCTVNHPSHLDDSFYLFSCMLLLFHLVILFVKVVNVFILPVRRCRTWRLVTILHHKREFPQSEQFCPSKFKLMMNVKLKSLKIFFKWPLM